ncbi:MAG: hypothetical protein ACETV1_07575 [Candidatus Bathyarchaeia archaeon]
MILQENCTSRKVRVTWSAKCVETVDTSFTERKLGIMRMATNNGRSHTAMGPKSAGKPTGRVTALRKGNGTTIRTGPTSGLSTGLMASGKPSRLGVTTVAKESQPDETKLEKS